MADNTTHQKGQQFPRLDMPIAEANYEDPGSARVVSRAWQRLFQNFWLRLGPATAPDNQQPISLTSNPFDYTATSGGVLVLSGGSLLFSRDGGTTFFQVGVPNMGGTMVLVPQDIARISWQGLVPQATFFPGL